MRSQIIVLLIILLPLATALEDKVLYDPNSVQNGKINLTLSDEEIKAALSLCHQKGGVGVGIKGEVYCQTGEVYTPIKNLLDQTKKVKILGMEMYDVGGLIMQDNPVGGWAILFVTIIIAFIFIKEERQLQKEKRIMRLEQETKEDYSWNNNSRKRRDGGFY